MSGLNSIFFRSNKKEKDTSENYHTLDFLFKDLKDQIESFEAPIELVARIKHFENLTPKEKTDVFPSLYLEIEDFLLFQEAYRSKTKQDFREAVFMEYPSIDTYNELRVVFLKQKIQKVGLSRLFLKDTLQEAKNLLGNFKDPYLVKAEKMLANPFMIDNFSLNEEIMSVQKQLLDHSNALQKKLKETLGKKAMLSIYTQCYNRHFNQYYLLESFTAVIQIIPEDLLKVDDVNLPSKGQMHRLLKTQVSLLEEINIKLNNEIKERKQIQKNLEKNERLYSAVLHNSLHANIIIDAEGTIRRWNSKAESLFKEGENLFELIPSIFTSKLIDRMGHSSLKEVKSITQETFEFSHHINETETTHQFSLKISPIFVGEEVLFFCVVNTMTTEGDQWKSLQVRS